MEKAFDAGKLKFFGTLETRQARSAFTQRLGRLKEREWVVHATQGSLRRTRPGARLCGLMYSSRRHPTTTGGWTSRHPSELPLERLSRGEWERSRTAASCSARAIRLQRPILAALGFHQNAVNACPVARPFKLIQLAESFRPGPAGRWSHSRALSPLPAIGRRTEPAAPNIARTFP